LALSSNTVEDAVMSKSILKEVEYKNLLILTSEYHLARVKFIFTEILKDFNLSFNAVTHHSIDDVLEPLIQHEKVAMDLLNSNGLYY
jgi:uncharacterized SAM-binding protein YcdF (DUF218 family)